MSGRLRIVSSLDRRRLKERSLADKLQEIGLRDPAQLQALSVMADLILRTLNESPHAHTG